MLLFAHWPVPYEIMRPLVPASLELETFEGSAWVGLTPFRVTRLRPRFGIRLPLVSTFPEMNLRTYVRVRDRAGIYFFTLEAASRFAVLAARLTYRLPYHRARMQVNRRDGWIHFASRRPRQDVEFRARYRPVGAPFRPQPGSLEHFLTERYALYSVLGSGRLFRGDIHHAPWTIRNAQAEIERNTVAAAHRIRVSAEPPLLHFAPRQDTLVWAPRLL